MLLLNYICKNKNGSNRSNRSNKQINKLINVRIEELESKIWSKRDLYYILRQCCLYSFNILDQYPHSQFNFEINRFLNRLRDEAWCYNAAISLDSPSSHNLKSLVSLLEFYWFHHSLWLNQTSLDIHQDCFSSIIGWDKLDTNILKF